MKKWLVIASTVILLSACTTEDDKKVDEPAKKNESPLVEQPTEVLNKNSLTGMKGSFKNGTHFSVMIENSKEARPQSGLSDADLVYEIKTEGNISRYLAFFHDNVPKVIGPVRSSRHYFIPLSEGFNFPYIHFGASTYAYDYLNSKDLSVPHIDGIKEGSHFFRDDSRFAPHNAYLRTDTLESFNNLDITNESFNFGKLTLKNAGSAKTIELTYNNFTDIKYIYDEVKDTYFRFQEEIPHIDNNSGNQIAVKNIVVQYAKHEDMQDDKKGRIEVSLTGVGKIKVFRGGVVVEGTWKKGIRDNAVTYYGQDGELLELTPGNTWVQVLDKETPVIYQ